ncbi:hypothetical protein ACFU5P_00370 [Streptomyces sp. NPDC057433]|uniref:hypothetical protein n=1 Tax=Streptomyces sp. NPDC057433 TaxID=3346132 RepID=UPI003698C67A
MPALEPDDVEDPLSPEEHPASAAVARTTEARTPATSVRNRRSPRPLPAPLLLLLLPVLLLVLVLFLLE